MNYYRAGHHLQDTATNETLVIVGNEANAPFLVRNERYYLHLRNASGATVDYYATGYARNELETKFVNLNGTEVESVNGLPRVRITYEHYLELLTIDPTIEAQECPLVDSRHK